jgi:F420H(2)-dependent quinone reductase
MRRQCCALASCRTFIHQDKGWIGDKQEVLTFNEANIAEFRTSHGRVASFGAAPLLLLTSIGARSGERRTNPMMYLANEHDPNVVFVFASAAGADQNQLTCSPNNSVPRSTPSKPASSPDLLDTRKKRRE